MEPLSPGDRALIAQIAAGDQRAADSFDARFRPQLLRFAQGRRIPIQDQKDLIQEVLLAAFQEIRKDNFQGKSSLGTWLVGILSHKIADYWEQNQRESDRIVSIEKSRPTAVQSPIDRIPDPTPHPDAALEVREILATLPKEHRVILLLNITEGWTTDEIAAALKMPPGTVGRVLWEAKQLLRGNQRILKKLAQGKD